MLSRALALALFSLMLAALPAAAQKRVALVIGNSTYQVQPPLNNARNDATAMARMLREELGFEVLPVLLNGTLPQMDEALERFAAAARDADIALFYFAGHGLEEGRNNFLVPIEAELAHENQIVRQTIALDQALKAMRHARARIVLLDACRNNPVAGRMVRSIPQRSGQAGGLAELQPADGLLVGYASAPGTTASDGASGGNSPFTAALLEHLPRPGEDLRLLLGDVRDAVKAATQGRAQQVPWVDGSVSGRLILKPAPPPPPPAYAVGAPDRFAVEGAPRRDQIDPNESSRLAGLDERRGPRSVSAAAPGSCPPAGTRAVYNVIRNGRRERMEITHQGPSAGQAHFCQTSAGAWLFNLRNFDRPSFAAHNTGFQSLLPLESGRSARWNFQSMSMTRQQLRDFQLAVSVLRQESISAGGREWTAWVIDMQETPLDRPDQGAGARYWRDSATGLLLQSILMDTHGASGFFSMELVEVQFPN